MPDGAGTGSPRARRGAALGRVSGHCAAACGGRREQAAAEAWELFSAVSSSLVVEPAASIPRFAKAAGTGVVSVNREPTPLDGIAHAVVRGEIGAVLAGLVGANG